MISVIDHGMGNVGSIINMLDHLEILARVTRDAKEIKESTGIILPGVGAFDTGMRHLSELGLVEPISYAVLEQKIPIMGICLGMQLLANGSEEGSLPGLGFINAYVRRIPENPEIKIPNIGWHQIFQSHPSRLFSDQECSSRFYFVHSYFVECVKQQDCTAIIRYGSPICCSIERENIFGVQFHPEKSHRFGMEIFNRFNTITRKLDQ